MSWTHSEDWEEPSWPSQVKKAISEYFQRVVIVFLPFGPSMFKKRTRPTNVRPKDSPLDVPGPSNYSPSRSPRSLTEDDESDLTANIDELILLRKLRKSKQGIDLEKFNRGDKKGHKDDSDYGLHKARARKRDDEETE